MLLLNELERHVLAERQVTASLIAGGAQDLEAPTYVGAREEFDQALVSEPVTESKQAKFLRELGVR